MVGIKSAKTGPGIKGVALYDSHTENPIRMATVDGVIRLPTSNPAISDFLINGRPTGSTQFSGFGEVSISGAQDNYDVWEGPTGIQPEPDTGGFNLYVESDDADDDSTGNGAKTISIHYLDTAGVEQTVSATLNGVTPVNTNVTDCMFINSAHITDHFGTGIVATGNIDCTKTSGGTVVQRIAAAGNQSLSTMRQVPVGKTLTVSGWHSYGVATTTKVASMRIRTSAHEGVLNAGVYHFQDVVRVKDSATGFIPLRFTVPALATIKVSAWTTGTILLSAHWQGWLEDA